MTRQHDPRRGDSAPSRRSVERLRAGLQAELSDLRETVDDELRLAQVLQDAGEVEAARLLLELPVERLHIARSRLVDVVAAAAVERAAEEVLAAAEVRVEPRPGRRTDLVLRRAPILLATILALAATMILTAPDPSPGTPSVVASASGSTDEVRPPGTDLGARFSPPPAEVDPGVTASRDPLVEGSADLRARWTAPTSWRVGGEVQAPPPAEETLALIGWVDPALLTLRETVEASASGLPADHPAEDTVEEALSGSGTGPHDLGGDAVGEAERSIGETTDGHGSAFDALREIVDERIDLDDDGDVVMGDDGR